MGGQGGIASFFLTYQTAGFFEAWNIRFIATHCAGSMIKKLQTAVLGYLILMGLLITKQVGIVHIHTASNASFWRKSIYIFIVYLARRPIILHVHGGGFADFFNIECNSFQKKYVRFVMGCCRCIVALSETWASRLYDISQHDHIVTIYNPVILSKHMPQPCIRDVASILFLGRIEPEKGVYDLLQALLELSKEFPTLRLLCGGDGEHEKFLAMASQLGIREQVVLLGWVSGAAKTDYLAQSTVFALPSYAEGMPVGVLEAMAAGTPVVASNVGGIPDTVRDGIDGLLLDAGDIKGLVAALGRVLRDPLLQRRLGESGRGRVESVFSADKVMAQMGQIYLDLGALPASPCI